MSARIIEGDCLEIMPTLEAGSIDAVITDPPYGMTSLWWDKTVEGWLDEAARVLKPWGSVWMFGNLRSIMALSLGDWKLAQDVIWEKPNGSNFHTDRFRRVHEIVIHLYRGRWEDIYKSPRVTMDARRLKMRREATTPHIGGRPGTTYERKNGGPRIMRSVLHVSSCHGYAVHPTQKPVALLTPLVEYSCPPGGVVLDPFAGSGSVGVSAESCGRSAILIEKEPLYVDAMRKRLANVQLGLTEAVS
jgi:site-specific DNA-methyltransferase (adenine-specific)